MPATLTVSSPAETYSFTLDARGKGEATFLLTNSSARPVQSRAIPVELDNSSRIAGPSASCSNNPTSLATKRCLAAIKPLAT